MQAACAANAEVVPHARSRQFSNADKRRTLDAADRCTRASEVGARVCREGVYGSSLSTWRRQREAGDLAALAPQERGSRIPVNRTETLLIAQLTRERDGLQRELDKALLVIGVQEKIATLLDTLNDNKCLSCSAREPRNCKTDHGTKYLMQNKKRCTARQVDKAVAGQHFTAGRLMAACMVLVDGTPIAQAAVATGKSHASVTQAVQLIFGEVAAMFQVPTQNGQLDPGTVS